MAGKTRTTITLEIEGGKIVKATSSNGAKSRRVSSSELESLPQRPKAAVRPQAAARPRAAVRSAESDAPCFVFIFTGGKWIKVPVPCS